MCSAMPVSFEGSNVMAACPVCKGRRHALLDHRPSTPVLMHKLYASPEEAAKAPTGKVELLRCEGCGFAFNAAFDPRLMVYDPAYDNAQTHSEVFRRHVDERAERVIEACRAVGRAHLVEVGAGQGSFLERLSALGAPHLASLSGFDPAWKGADDAGPAGSRMHRRLFDREAARLLDHAPDVVVSRHTIEHVADPLGFLRGIHAAMEGAGGGVLFVETPDIEWIERNVAFEDVFYEHCSLFDPGSLSLALTLSGFSEPHVETCFGGQYLWATARRLPSAAAEADDAPPAVRPFAAAIAGWRARLEGAAASGESIVVWGAGAKGMTFAQMLDPDAARIAAIVDINPGKQGRCIAMSGHRVVPPEALSSLRPNLIIVMNPIYAGEIAELVRSLGLSPRLMTLHEA